MGIVNPIALLTFMQIPNGLMTISQDGQPTNVLIMAFMAYVDRIYIYFWAFNHQTYVWMQGTMFDK
jgi:hypothetical protein